MHVWFSLLPDIFLLQVKFRIKFKVKLAKHRGVDPGISSLLLPLAWLFVSSNWLLGSFTVLEENVLQQKRGLRETLLLTIRPLSRLMPNTLTLTWTHKSEVKELFYSSTIANGQSILIEQQQGSHGCPLASDLAELPYLMSTRATYAPFLFYSFKK